jgi:N-sulfoglucosamine sulfohydrolase
MFFTDPHLTYVPYPRFSGYIKGVFRGGPITIGVSDHPNICLVHCHDLGRYLGCYDFDVDTPRIDSLASDGAVFENAFATAPQCSPSRASLHTGRHPHENGLIGLAHEEPTLNDDERLLVEYLSAAGYETHLFGLQHVTEHPDQLGFDELHSERHLSPDVPPSVHETDRAREVSERFADCLGDGDLGDPFFASIGFFELHRLEDDGQFRFADDRYEPADPEAVETLPYLPDEPGVRRDLADAQGMVRAIDRGVGRVLDALEDATIREETLVIFTTEHGLAMPRAKGSVYDPGIEIALLASLPGTIEPGTRHDEMISNVDVLPTLLDLIEEEVPGQVSGRSFLPLLRGKEYDTRERLFAGMTWHDAYNPVRTIRTRRFKYVRSFWQLPDVYLPHDVGHSPAGEEVRDEFGQLDRPYEELYDLDADPHERENIAGEAEYAGTTERLREELQEWMEATDDPLLSGPVPPSDFEAMMA